MASLGGTTPETVEANAIAKSKNAHVVSLTRTVDSPLTKDADFAIIHRFAENYGAKLEKTGYAMDLALEILQQIEGYEHYDKMIDGFTKIYDLSQKSVVSVGLNAKKFGEKYKDDECIYVMSSGASLRSSFPCVCRRIISCKTTSTYKTPLYVEIKVLILLNQGGVL